MTSETVIETASVDVLEVADDEVSIDNQLYFRIYRLYREGRLRVPTMPDLAARIRQAVADPGASANEIAKIIQADPALTAYLIRVANSPIYHTGRPVQELRRAVTRLGLDMARDMVMSFTLKNLFNSRNPVLKQRMRELWMHSCAVGATSYVLAGETRAANPEQALLAGLLHDMGVAVILTHAEDYPMLLKDAARLDEAQAKLRGRAGSMVLTKWKFDEEIIKAAAGAEDWCRDSGPRADLCDIVVAAQLLLHQADDDGRCLPAAETTPAYIKLAAGMTTVEFSAKIMRAAHHELSEIRALLHI